MERRREQTRGRETLDICRDVATSGYGNSVSGSVSRAVIAARHATPLAFRRPMNAIPSHLGGQPREPDHAQDPGDFLDLYRHVKSNQVSPKILGAMADWLVARLVGPPVVK